MPVRFGYPAPEPRPIVSGRPRLRGGGGLSGLADVAVNETSLPVAQRPPNLTFAAVLGNDRFVPKVGRWGLPESCHISWVRIRCRQSNWADKWRFSEEKVDEAHSEVSREIGSIRSTANQLLSAW